MIKQLVVLFSKLLAGCAASYTAVAIVLLSLLILPANADEFSGSNGDVPTTAATDVPDCVTCNDWVLVSECPKYITEIEVEVPVIVEVPFAVEVPVYLPEGSSSIWDNSGQLLYLYDTDVYEGPKRTGQILPYAVLKYIEDFNFELIELQ